MRGAVSFFFIFCGLLVFTGNTSLAQKNWTGNGANALWSTAANWLPSGAPAAGDVVQIGVISYGSRPAPVLNVSTTVSAIIFGADIPYIKTLTVSGAATVLTVTGNITQYHSPVSVTNAVLQAQLTGNGTIICNGDVQTGIGLPSITALGLLGFENTSQIISTVNSLQVKGNLTITSSETPLLNLLGLQIGLAKNNALFSLEAGTFSLAKQIITSNYLSPALLGTPVSTTTARYQTYANNNLSATLQLQNANALQINNPAIFYENGTAATKGNSVDFYVPVSGTGNSFVDYACADAQTVYSSTATSGLDNAGKIASGTTPFYQAYQGLKFSGAGLKTLRSGSLFIGGSWESGGGKVDGLSNNTLICFFGNSSAQTINDTGSDNGIGVVWKDVVFDNKNIGSDIKTIQSGNFAIAANGTLSVTGLANLKVDNLAGGNASFTLKSDAGNSASVLPIPAGSSVTGNVNVERFVKGSNNLSKRGYRLLSSTVNTASPNINGTAISSFNPNYLLNSAYVSGLAGGGFNVTGNPSLYLYREDLVPTGATFTSSNYKGIASLSTVSPYSVTTQNRANTSYTSDTTVNIPVGTGLLFFFRGNKTDNATQSGSKTIAPFDYPEDVVFTSTGGLNQGTVNVQTWFAKTNPGLLQYSISIANDVSPRNVRGYHLVGNPYASSINWNKINGQSTMANSSIYGPNVERTVWFFNPTNKQYGAYLAPANADTVSATPFAGTNGASNIIASGQGFFIRTKPGGSTMRFTESAKTVTQPTSTSLNLLMGIPVSTVEDVQPYMRIQLKKDSVNDDDILIRFFEKGHDNYVLDEDAEDMAVTGRWFRYRVFRVIKRASWLSTVCRLFHRLKKSVCLPMQPPAACMNCTVKSWWAWPMYIKFD